MATRTAHRGRDLVRARELLARADVLVAHSADATDRADAMRDLYFAALRAAGAVLAVAETPRARRGSASAWARLPRVLPELTTWSTYFAGVARLCADLDIGVVGEVAESVVAELRRRVVDFVDDIDELVGAWEREEAGLATSGGALRHARGGRAEVAGSVSVTATSRRTA
ncbi:SAV_6107 family HEPN domain-containing protein [Williamsia sp. CHRR-6]|uniref:SAV_6107 family HEPN domain-containing protein n=1 Tax=Williamsia sp. CHRR-6 TaxID=2835871 RepID=UPI001BDB6B6C|nr:SAV_6107 family HEPN domain-containing protein [Williamsia sp. CHRR-6]MBT0565272.1 hypothetical protein [Williamsia sp. CHRR-6]